ncbi:MAG: transketolase [Bacteroidota bacterium]
MSSTLDQLCINTIRTLAMDGVQKAKSGHPGMPMGMAPVAYVLWTKHLNHNPANMHWQNRDRFILSGGHGSMLLYSLLHLTGYKVSLDDLKSFRQLGSLTPGHPEYGHTDGVEVTTGPLGQGFTNGIGMAIAQKYLAARYNRPGFKIVDYNIYATLGDGDLMEGITSEAGSLAGHLKLDNLIYLYDDNHISIDGPTEIAFTEDRAKRFEAYGWFVQKVKDGNDLKAIDNAIQRAKKEKGRPSIIMVRTHIGFGSPHKQDTAEVHGSALGEEEIKLTKEFYHWDPEKQFYIPEKALAQFRKAIEIGKKKEAKWNEKSDAYKQKFPELAAEFENIHQGNFGENWKKALPTFTDAMATREASGKILNAIAPFLPSMIGGSADLAPSNNTFVKSMGEFQPGNYGGRYLRYGVREHAMGGIMNGLAVTDGIIPYGGTFFVFSDYMRGSIRLACIMNIRPIYVFTHDSIGVGEDGPTHEPVEQLAALRCIPNMISLRPSDANETVAAWKFAIEYKTGPVALLLTRQKLPTIDRTKYPSADNLTKGAYVLVENSSTSDLILIGTGSEVQLALGAYEQLVKEGVKARVVGMPSWELFERQSKEYRDSVLPPNVKKRVAVEALITMGWEKYVGDSGRIIGMHSFGTSAPVDVIFKHFGFTVENVVKTAKEIL